jgi:bifunctional non-homologous end joining protein LigD
MHSRQFHFGKPDYAFFDLDPFQPITFDVVRRVALMVRVALDRLGIRSYPKTSGETGMQVYVPLDGSHTYEEARAFVERVCRLIHRTWPEGTTMEWDVSKRAGKVYLDYGMVREGANIASVYSVRPSAVASISTPLRWEEVEEDIHPHDFTIATIWERLETTGDLFAAVLEGGTPKGHNLWAAMEDLGIDRRAFATTNAPEADAESRRPPDLEKGAGSSKARGSKSRTASARDGAASPDLTIYGEPLSEYKRKRRFDVTPEPEGAVAEASEQPLYMIHKHHARRLHYDLRLERDGVLVSFAVPKGLPEEPNVRRLAVHVEDHPMDYAHFEGRIPEGEYGAGEVRIFDWGTYEAPEWTEKKITLRLRGERLQGEYHLVRTDGKNWLIFRSARAGRLEQGDVPPRTIEPMMATGGGKPFDSPGWTFEPKWDGVRTLAFIDSGRTALRSRRGRDVEGLYPELSEMAVQLSGFNGLVDGEIVGLDEKGHPSFERIQQRFTLAKPTQQALTRYPVEYVAFDLLWLDGESLLDQPLEERRALLERHVVPGKHVQVSPQFEEHGVAFFEAAKAQGFEGLIAKKKGSIYRPGQRSKDWLKIKFVKEQDCVIVGWVPGEKGRAGQVGSLLAAIYQDGGLVYAGHVGTGFTAQTLRLLQEKLEPLAQKEPPLPHPPRDEVDPRTARWVRPELVCSVEYLQFTTQGRMRAASFKGLRDDKLPEDCVREES